MKSIFNFQFSIFKKEEGQSLITLLFFMVIGITVVSAAALIVSADILTSSTAEQGLDAYYSAESGAEDGILYLLSHPNYAGSDLIINTGGVNATIHFVYSSPTDTITSTGVYNNSTRKIQVVTNNASGPLSITSWTETTN